MLRIGSTLETIGLLGIYLYNIPLYIYKIVRAMFMGQHIPTYRYLFYIPQWLNSYVKFIGVGILVLFFVLIAIYE